MTDSEKKVFEGYLSKALKLDTEAIAGLYNEAGELADLTAASEADTNRIKKLKEEASSQYKRGLKEGASKIEDELKKKYSVESDLIGVELVDQILEQQMNEVKGAGDKEIEKHPEFVKLKLEHEKALKARDKEWQKRIEEKESEFSKKALFSKIKEKALAELESLRPILPEDSNKALKWKEKFIDEFTKHEYQEQEGTFVVLKDGKPATDSHGHIRNFSDHVKDIANDFFDFQTAEQRSSSGNRGSSGTAFVAPKNNDEYVAKMREAKTPEERMKIADSFGVLTKK